MDTQTMENTEKTSTVEFRFTATTADRAVDLRVRVFDDPALSWIDICDQAYEIACARAAGLLDTDDFDCFEGE